MMPHTVSFLSALLNKTMDILEFGSGGSTLMFARRCNSVLSYETSEEWLTKINAKLVEKNLSDRAIVKFRPELNSGKMPPDFDYSQEYDLILCDGCREGRNEFIMQTWPLVITGGWYVVDNSSQFEYMEGMRQLRSRGWPEYTIPTCPPSEASQTSFFRRSWKYKE
jgi:predicted O-methyltransferase YrrM